jgi:hypothetical protein
MVDDVWIHGTPDTAPLDPGYQHVFSGRTIESLDWRRFFRDRGALYDFRQRCERRTAATAL